MTLRARRAAVVFLVGATIAASCALPPYEVGGPGSAGEGGGGGATPSTTIVASGSSASQGSTGTGGDDTGSATSSSSSGGGTDGGSPADCPPTGGPVPQSECPGSVSCEGPYFDTQNCCLASIHCAEKGKLWETKGCVPFCPFDGPLKPECKCNPQNSSLQCDNGGKLCTNTPGAPIVQCIGGVYKPAPCCGDTPCGYGSICKKEAGPMGEVHESCVPDKNDCANQSVDNREDCYCKACLNPAECHLTELNRVDCTGP